MAKLLIGCTNFASRRVHIDISQCLIRLWRHIGCGERCRTCSIVCVPLVDESSALAHIPRSCWPSIALSKQRSHARITPANAPCYRKTASRGVIVTTECPILALLDVANFPRDLMVVVFSYSKLLSRLHQTKVHSPISIDSSAKASNVHKYA